MSRRRVTLVLPGDLVAEIDGLVRQSGGSRSQVVAEAVAQFIVSRREKRLADLAAGYRDMSDLNLALAEEGMAEGWVFPQEGWPPGTGGDGR